MNQAVAAKKVLTLGYVPWGTGQHKPFDAVFSKALHVSPDDIRQGKVDALVIWGGSDISPSLYGEAPNGAHAGVDLSERDHVEKDVCDAAIEVGVPIIGVCRGAQLLCALAGGKLYQDVSGHHSSHSIITKDGEKYTTSSIHHQMMDVTGLPEKDFDLIAWTDDALAKEVKGAVEPEIVYFPQIHGLAIQGHPEFMNPNCDFVQYTLSLVEQYLLGETA